MLNASADQCRDCVHHQRRGGIVFPAKLGCVRLEGNDTSAVIANILQVLSVDGRCPEHKPYEIQPDSYLSEDLLPLVFSIQGLQSETTQG